MKNVVLLALISLLFFSACKPPKDEINSENEDVSVHQPLKENKNQILFLYFEVKKGADGSEDIQLVQIQPVDGKMKKHAIRPTPKAEGNYIVRVFNDENLVVEQVTANPLVKHMEHYADGNEMVTNVIELEEAPFFVRFNIETSVNTVKIFKIQSEKEVAFFSFFKI